MYWYIENNMNIAHLERKGRQQRMKDIFEYLLKSSSLYEGINNYIKALDAEFKVSKDLNILEKKNAITYYKNSIYNKDLIAEHRENFNGLYTALEDGLPSMQFNLDGNKKSLKSWLEKLEMLQQKKRGIEDSYKDIHRFRLIVTNSKIDNCDLITMLEEATVITINYFLGKGFNLCQLDPPKDTIDINNELEVEDFLKKYSPAYIQPIERSIIPPEFGRRIKNYIIEPKENGYQGIHLLFSNSEHEFFEVQLKTYAQFIRAEYKSASHDKFKKSTRKIHEWELEKINFGGFYYCQYIDPNGIPREAIDDQIGLVKPLETVKRNKTF